MKITNKLMLLLSFMSLIVACNETESKKEKIVFEPTVESLRQYKCPEWFRDAKFGIWSCWNAYAVPGMNDWYARNMYMEGSAAYTYHCKTYGHPSEFGYKDVVELWKGENFNPKEQVELFKKAGAKYFIAMANHHDNFDLWDSKYQPWNSVNNGPRRNIIKEWHDAVEGSGMRWGLTSHLERTWSWFQVNKLSDTKGKYKGVPYDGANPEYEQIYLPADPNGDTSRSQPVNATEWWREYWYNRCADLIDKYKPDLFYVDGGVPFPGDDKGATGLRMISHLYNKNASWHNGENEAVMCIKDWYHIAPKGEWGFYWDGIATLDYERSRSSKILPEPWQTDTHLGSWTWIPNMKYRPANEVILELVDVVSKNGNLLVNITPRPDGTLDDGAKEVLNGIGNWMIVNSESIYETRPWLIYGDGDLRIVKKGEKSDLLYLTSLVKPQYNQLIVPFLVDNNNTKIKNIELLSSGENISFTESDKGLVLNIPDNLEGEYAWVFKIEGDNLCSYNIEKFYVADKPDYKQEINIWKDISILEKTSSDFKSISYDRKGVKWAIDNDDNLVSIVDTKIKKYGYKVEDIDFTITGYSGFITTSGEVYFSNNKGENWEKISAIDGAKRISIDDNGEIWIACDNQTVWRKTKDGSIENMKLKAFDISCGPDGVVAIIVPYMKSVQLLKNGIAQKGNYGIEIEKIDFSPKTGHLLAVYKGELAIFKDGVWVFTGEKATDVSAGKRNDEEVIGWI